MAPGTTAREKTAPGKTAREKRAFNPLLALLGALAMLFFIFPLVGLITGAPWGHIVSVMVNGRVWSAAPGRMLVANQVVRLHRTTAVHAPNTVVLLAPGRGRWDLLVVPPDTTEDAAEPLMAAAADGVR